MTSWDRRRDRDRSVLARLSTPLLASVLALAACSPAPAPSPPAGSAVPFATHGPSTPAGSAVPIAEPPLAAELRDGLDPAAILADLARLQDLALANEGSRAAGSASEEAATGYIADELRAAGFLVEVQDVPVPWFSQDAPTVLAIDGSGTALEDLHDFKAMLLSPSGDLQAPLHAVAFDPAALPGDRSGAGCDPADFEDVPEGAIVVVRPGPCFRRDVVVNAEGAGAAALVTSYPEWERDMVLRPTLVDPDGLRIPALAVTNDVGLTLAEAAERGVTAHIEVHATVEARSGINVIAETAGGAADHVLYVGGHIDTSIDGPGVNDDGSGTMTVLEIGRRLAAATRGPQSQAGDGWKVRLGFWTGEEIALLGSSAYVQGLGPEDVAAAEAYLNLDMLGSPNGIREIYGGAETTRPIESEVIAELFSSAFDRAGLSSTVVDLNGASDHAAFNNAAIPTGGIFSGANEAKSPEQATLFGGTAGTPEDPCYHLACDTTDNVDPKLLEEMARAAAWVVGALASGEVTLRGG